MKTISIAEILSPYLGSRAQAKGFRRFVDENCTEDSVQIHFCDVQFSSRAFMDEFYNLFLSPSVVSSGRKAEVVNMREDISAILDSVIRANITPRAKAVDNPCVGIFWYDLDSRSLFGVRKEAWSPSRMEAAACDGLPFIDYPETNREVWEQESFPGDYARTPRGRVSWAVNKFVVLVGNWARPIQDEITALLKKEFSLPSFELVFDAHWDLKP